MPGSPSPGGGASVTGKPAASQASNPPTTSPARVKPSSARLAAARLEDSPCSQIRTSRVSSETACGLRHARYPARAATGGRRAGRGAIPERSRVSDRLACRRSRPRPAPPTTPRRVRAARSLRAQPPAIRRAWDAASGCSSACRRRARPCGRGRRTALPRAAAQPPCRRAPLARDVLSPCRGGSGSARAA